MTNRFSLLCVLLIFCIFAGQGCRRQSRILEPAEITLLGVEDDTCKLQTEAGRR